MATSTALDALFLGAIERADRRTLAAVATHLSGDPELIGVDEDGASVRIIATDVLRGFVDLTAVPAPSETVLQAAMRHAAGEALPAEYGDLARQHMGEFGPPEIVEPLRAPSGFKVVIIGAGLTGLAVGLRLRALGFTDFTILDRNEAVGGTWWQNRYPGCRVDTPSVVYTYSSHPNSWPNHFSSQPDILAYLEDVSHELTDHIHTGVEVQGLAWVERDSRWTIRGTEKGEDFVTEANVVVGATGFLNIPSVPRIDGADTFAGDSFHSAEWPAADCVTGRSVAVVGTGASANQIVPATARLAEHVTVFQRSPHWITSHPYYGRSITGPERFLLERIPTYRGWFRFRQFWTIGDQNLPFTRIDPAWPYPERSISKSNDEIRVALTEYILSQVGDRADLVAKVVPAYPPFAKRIVVDNGWYRALRRDNVSLVTEPISRITPGGIETSAGFVPVETIIWATGFQTNRVLWPIEIVGRGGVELRARLDTAPEAYLGFALESCPNLFVTTGPNGIPVHGGTLSFLAECQARYIGECLRHMFASDWSSIEIKPGALRRFVRDMHEENSNYVWTTDGVDNWFKGAVGTTSLVLPWTNLRVWQESRHPDMTVYRGRRR